MYDGATHVPHASVGAAARHTVTAASASQALNLAGLKAAHMVFSNAADRGKWAGVKRFAKQGAISPGVVANIAAYASGGPWLKDVLTYLVGARWLQPEGSYLAFIDCPGLGITGSPADFSAERAGGPTWRTD